MATFIFPSLCLSARDSTNVAGQDNNFRGKILALSPDKTLNGFRRKGACSEFIVSLFHTKCIFLANPVHAPFCHSGSRLYRTGETNPRRHQLTFCANASSFPSWQVRLASLTGTFFAGIPSFHFLLVQKSYFLIREERMKEEEEGTNANFVLSPPNHIPSPPLKKEPYWISTNCFIFLGGVCDAFVFHCQAFGVLRSAPE